LTEILELKNTMVELKNFKESISRRCIHAEERIREHEDTSLSKEQKNKRMNKENL
jgi:hypothetical protein